MNILLLGSDGLLGMNILSKYQDDYNFVCLYNKNIPKVENLKRYKFNKKNLIKIYKNFNIEVILNCAGLTNIEECEKNKNKARIAHIKILNDISQVFKKKKLTFVHISTDHLFDGKKNFYSENSKTKPLNYYAITKLQSEKIIKKNFKKFLIIRGNFFGWGIGRRKSFSDWIINSLLKKKEINLFSDVYFTPLNIEIFNKIIFKLIEKKIYGTFNVCSNQRLSKYQFGILISNKIKKIQHRIIKSSIKKFKLVKRPLDMSLSNKKLRNKLKILKKELDIFYQITVLFKQKKIKDK
jgi:dTDP-4-dehydrorhamnose reductase